MQAIQFDAAIPRYALGMALRKLSPAILWSGLSCTYLRNIDPPALPGPDWAVVRTRLGGICGSDLGTIGLHTSPYYSPFSSFPFTMGHENVGVLGETGPGVDLPSGTRVVIEPLLWCRPRGFEDLCEYCAKGEINRCQRQDAGDLRPGLFIGNCIDTGGSWSEQFVAHSSQIYALPDSISDEAAVMIEPFACGLHAVLQAPLAEAEHVLVLGSGTIGLCTLAAIKAIRPETRVTITSRYAFQAQAAAQLGADRIIGPEASDSLATIAAQVGGTIKKTIIGKPVVGGGADLTFECVGSDAAIDSALRLTASGGTMMLVGVPGIARGIDWTALFAQELVVKASTIYHHAERYGGQQVKTFDLAIQLMVEGRINLGHLVGHSYPLSDFKKALADIRGRRQPIIKAVFKFPHESG